MNFDRHCTEIIAQTDLLTTGLATADLPAPVPSCPGWTLGQLVRHIGGGHRWAEETIRTRATAFLPDDQLRELAGDDSGTVPTADLTEGARALADTLRAAGPNTKVWAPFDYDTTAFWARRFTHETVVHRADATLAAGTDFTVAQDVALDGIDEWLELDALPQHFDLDPRRRDLIGPGRTIALDATDTDAAWFIDLTTDVITWRRERAPAAVTVHAALTDLLLIIYRRKAVPANNIDGDRRLLDFWLDHVGFE